MEYGAILTAFSSDLQNSHRCLPKLVGLSQCIKKQDWQDFLVVLHSNQILLITHTCSKFILEISSLLKACFFFNLFVLCLLFSCCVAWPGLFYDPSALVMSFHIPSSHKIADNTLYLVLDAVCVKDPDTQQKKKKKSW